jgi:peptidoglycan hydrolase-like protein with peptidoglycan-binding domain
MRLSFAVFWIVLVIGAPSLLGGSGQTQPTTAVLAQDQDPPATRDLVREIQFMLLRVGFDPGPLDGMPSTRTNRAVRRFQEMHGLPATELKRGGKVPTQLIARLRKEAAPALSGGADRVETPPRSPSPAVVQLSPSDETLPPKSATDAIAPPPLKPTARDPLASCSYDPHDFQIGPNRYTPDTFLKEGFDGLTNQAVLELKDRLEEGRQIADRVGASALPEVQRQARVLQYFECRLKIEQTAASKD